MAGTFTFGGVCAIIALAATAAGEGAAAGGAAAICASARDDSNIAAPRDVVININASSKNFLASIVVSSLPIPK
ncbi:MAG TPA: hypothetical protein VMV27_08655 [Candidatus Binataceae bacterium]|nr:hypothetical protein [Candidatus Binataceae bacterium]